MQDDSNLSNQSPRKSKVERAHSFMTDSFRMAASVLGSNAASRKAHTLTVPKLEIKDKDSYKKQPECQICFVSFGKFGQHHCRICANAVCSSCSYSTINKQRACDKCAYHYSDPEREQFKQSSLKNLTNLCVQYLSNKHKMELQLKDLEQQVPKEEEKQKERRQAEERNKKMNQRLEQLAIARKSLEAEIASIRDS